MQIHVTQILELVKLFDQVNLSKQDNEHYSNLFSSISQQPNRKQENACPLPHPKERKKNKKKEQLVPDAQAFLQRQTQKLLKKSLDQKRRLRSKPCKNTQNIFIYLSKLNRTRRQIRIKCSIHFNCEKTDKKE